MNQINRRHSNQMSMPTIDSKRLQLNALVTGSPRRISPFTSFDSIKSTSIHQPLNSPKSNLLSFRSQTKSSHSNVFFSKKASMELMTEKYSGHYDLIQNSEPLETWHYVPPSVEEPPPVKEKTEQELDPLSLKELVADYSNKITIIRFRFQYFYLKLLEKESPLQLYFKSESFKNIKIFASTTATHPNKFNSELVITSKFFKFADRHHQPLFSDKNLYLAIYSEDDMDLQILYTFGEKIIKKKRNNLKKVQYKQYMNTTTNSYFMDKIRQNLDTSKFNREARQTKIMVQNEILDLRIKQVLSKKKELQQSKKLDIVSKLKANEALKEIWYQKKVDLQRKLYYSKIANFWLKTLALISYSDRIKTAIEETKHRNKMIAKGRIIAWTYKTKTIIKIKKTGQTIRERTVYKGASTIIMFCKQLNFNIKRKCGKVVHHIFKVTHMYLMFVRNHKIMTDKVNYVKKVFKTLKLKQRAYKDRLHRQLSKNSGEIFRFLGLSNPHSKKKTYHAPLDNNLLDKIIEEYMMNKKKKLQTFVQSQVQAKDHKKKVLDFALNMMQPEMFEAPSFEILTELMQIYAVTKKLIVK